MEDTVPILEKEIQDFVFSLTGERVELNLGIEGQVTIKPINHHGSTILGMFWLHVLQHPNNYPIKQYPYRPLYQARGKYRVTLQVDSINITTCLATGQFTVSGSVALDWFALRFSSIMKAYTRPEGSAQDLKEPFDAEQHRLMKTVRKIMLSEYYEVWPDVVVDDDMNVLDAHKILREKCREAQEIAVSEGKILPVGPLRGEKPDSIIYIDNLLTPSSFSVKLENLKKGIMVNGDELYSVWSTLLNRWFTDKEVQVYLVTPVLDAPSLERLCHLYLNNRLTASLTMLATPLQSRCGHLADIRRCVMQNLPTKDQIFVEYNVYNSMVYPRIEFQAKFTAGVCGQNVEVLMTSANCEKKHFTANHSSMALFQEMSLTDFNSRLLAPIISSVD